MGEKGLGTTSKKGMNRLGFSGKELDGVIVVELIGYYNIMRRREETLDTVFYRLSDGRIIEMLQIISRDLHALVGVISEEACLARSLLEDNFQWVHSPRNMRLKVGSCKNAEFI